MSINESSLTHIPYVPLQLPLTENTHVDLICLFKQNFEASTSPSLGIKFQKHQSSVSSPGIQTEIGIYIDHLNTNIVFER